MSHRFKQVSDSRRTDQFVECMIGLYNKASSHISYSKYISYECCLSPKSQMKKVFTRDQRSHYSFTPKMLSRLIESLKFYPDNFFQQV